MAVASLDFGRCGNTASPAHSLLTSADRAAAAEPASHVCRTTGSSAGLAGPGGAAHSWLP